MPVTTNRGFRNVVFFRKVGTGSDGFPLVKPPILFGEVGKINNKGLSLEDKVQEENIYADNVNEVVKTVIQKMGVLRTYDVTRAAFVEVFGFEEDDNGNIMDNPNGQRVDGVLFFETEKSDGTRMQHWFMDCSLYAPADAADSFDGTNARDLELAISCRPSQICGNLRFKVTVYSGKTGFVEGIPTAIYKPTLTNSAVATPTASPEAGAVAAGTLVELTTSTLGATIYYSEDSTDPTASSTLYSEPIVISAPTTIKAIAIKAGKTNSEVLTAAYTIAN